MDKSENIEMLKNLLQEMLEKMTFSDFSVEAREEADSDGASVDLNVTAKESDLLIGQYGANLSALQHIMRAIARKKTEERLRFSVDVNNYRREKIDSLKELTLLMAKQATEEKRPIVLRPMSSYERRIVHLVLSENDQVTTESIGEGEERKVVIKPIGNVEGGS